MKLETLTSTISEKEIVATIIDKFKNPPSIISIKNDFQPTAEPNIKAATVDQINKIINLGAKKATRPDKIPAKVVKMTGYIIDKNIANIINNDLLRSSFLDSAKIASIRPIFNKGEGTEIGNYRPVSILNCFSKIHQRFLHNQIASFLINKFLSDFISAYRKGYSANHALIRLFENWKISLDKNLFTGAILIDLSKAFDCIPHDLLIAKLYAYGLSCDTVTFVNSYLKVRKKNVRINNIFSAFHIFNTRFYIRSDPFQYISQ